MPLRDRHAPPQGFRVLDGRLDVLVGMPRSHLRISADIAPSAHPFATVRVLASLAPISTIGRSADAIKPEGRHRTDDVAMRPVYSETCRVVMRPANRMARSGLADQRTPSPPVGRSGPSANCWGPIMSDDPSKGAPPLRMPVTSPLLADAEWIIGFRWMVEELVKTGRAVTRHGSMSSYRLAMIETKWKPWLNGLARHVYRVVEDGRNAPSIRCYTFDGNIGEAYQLACAAFDEAADEAGPNDAMMAALEDIAERLARWQAPAAPADSPPEPCNLVTLDQAAATVNKQKRALEYYKTKGTLPNPAVEGGGGKAALYDWAIIGPWLTKQFGMQLPERFPGR